MSKMGYLLKEYLQTKVSMQIKQPPRIGKMCLWSTLEAGLVRRPIAGFPGRPYGSAGADKREKFFGHHP